MNDKERMDQIVMQLEQRFSPNKGRWQSDPFQVLIATILSQNTSDRNAHQAFLRLGERFNVTPTVLAGLQPMDIKPMIRCAGLSEIRSRRIIEISKEVLRQFNGDLSRIFQRPLNNARKTLMNMKGIGPKTADVVLLFSGGFPVMPIDTNIFRIVNRMGFVTGRNYERTRKALERIIPPSKLRDVHVLLIRLGRDICKPRRPQCSTCPVNSCCNYDSKSIERK